MSKQRICSYSGAHVSEIRDEIREDTERFNMPVKDVSLSSCTSYGSTYHYAIAVFEEEKEGE